MPFEAARLGWPVVTSHSLTVLSSLRRGQDRFPSGLKATLSTQPWWPLQLARRPAGLHVPQPDRLVPTREARICPSGLKATLLH